MPKLIYITSCQRSGSTMLDALLNNHVQIQGVGEVHRLVRYAISNEDNCTCGEKVSECPFWLAVESEFVNIVGNPQDRPLLSKAYELELKVGVQSKLMNAIERALLITPCVPFKTALWKSLCPDHARAIRSTLLWHRAIAKACDVTHVLESSKDIRRLLALAMFYKTDLKTLCVVRDGRGVINSLRKRLRMDIAEATNNWVYSVRSMLVAEKSLAPTAPALRIRYEDICNNLDETLAEMCRYLGVQNHSSMKKLNRADSHNIAGSPTRHDKDVVDVVEDTSWKNELSPRDLSVFDQIGGKLNRKLGYHI